MIWDSERALDECQDEMDMGAYDVRCRGCGAMFDTCPEGCPLCGAVEFDPVDDIPW